jgi:hypothetical protein
MLLQQIKRHDAEMAFFKKTFIKISWKSEGATHGLQRALVSLHFISLAKEMRLQITLRLSVYSQPMIMIMVTTASFSYFLFPFHETLF